MSYEIYYDRAFIRVNNLYIPIVNKGSNNCWEYSYFSGRDVPEKNWQVLNWKDRTKLLYTEDEVRTIALDYEEISQESGTCFKSRNRQFENGAFEKWIVCGLKSAFTIEEYVAAGNSLEVLDYSDKEIRDWKRYPFSNTDEFLVLLKTLEGRPLLNIHFLNNRMLYRPIKQKQRPEVYYVLATGDAYFCKLTKRGYRLTDILPNKHVRVFTSEQAAHSYLRKYAYRINQSSFAVKKIDGMKQAS